VSSPEPIAFSQGVGVVFKRLLQAMGVGGPSVETVLANPNCRPGGFLDGTVHVAGGGEHPIDVEYVAIGLTTRVSVEGGASAYSVDQEFHRQRLTGSFRLDPHARHEIPFHFEVPYQTPITQLYGQRLHGMAMALRTELEVAREVDNSDRDDVAVHPLPAQERILDAVLRLGFRFVRADVERGRILGADQRLPFYQEIEFAPPAAYAAAMEQLELTFLPTPRVLQVVLEVERRRGLPVEGRDAFARFDVDPAGASDVDWPAQLDVWLREAAARRGIRL
jgi:sporulation-control protein